MTGDTHHESADPSISRTDGEVHGKIDELWAYDDYSQGPRGKNLKYKHQGWIDALRWVLGNDLPEEP